MTGWRNEIEEAERALRNARRAADRRDRWLCLEIARKRIAGVMAELPASSLADAVLARFWAQGNLAPEGAVLDRGEPEDDMERARR